MMSYHGVVRTTISLPDHLLVQAKELAARRRTSFTKVVEESLRRYLAEERHQDRRGAVREVDLPVVYDAGPLPGIDFGDTSELMEL